MLRLGGTKCVHQGSQLGPDVRPFDESIGHFISKRLTKSSAKSVSGDPHCAFVHPLTLGDLAARVAFLPLELPVGVLTAMIGGPFFIVLLRRGVRRHAID